MSCGRIRVITQKQLLNLSHKIMRLIIRGRESSLIIHILPWANCHWATQVPTLHLTAEEIVRCKWFDCPSLALNQEHFGLDDQSFVCSSTYCFSSQSRTLCSRSKFCLQLHLLPTLAPGKLPLGYPRSPIWAAFRSGKRGVQIRYE